MLTPMIFLGFTILICLASINHNLIEKFLVFCFLICIEPRCWQAQPRGRVSGLLLSDMHRELVALSIRKANVSALLLSNILICIETVLVISHANDGVSVVLLSDVHWTIAELLLEYPLVSDRLLSDMFRTLCLPDWLSFLCFWPSIFWYVLNLNRNIYLCMYWFLTVYFLIYMASFSFSNQ